MKIFGIVNSCSVYGGVFSLNRISDPIKCTLNCIVQPTEKLPSLKIYHLNHLFTGLYTELSKRHVTLSCSLPTCNTVFKWGPAGDSGDINLEKEKKQLNTWSRCAYYWHILEIPRTYPQCGGEKAAVARPRQITTVTVQYIRLKIQVTQRAAQSM